MDDPDRSPAQSGGFCCLPDPFVRAGPGADRRSSRHHRGRLLYHAADQRVGLPPPGRRILLPEKDPLHRPKDRVHPAGQRYPHLWAWPLALGYLRENPPALRRLHQPAGADLHRCLCGGCSAQSGPQRYRLRLSHPAHPRGGAARFPIPPLLLSLHRLFHLGDGHSAGVLDPPQGEP